MSVIPLQRGKTVVESPEDFVALSEAARISPLIDFAEGSVSYDLHVGKKYSRHTDAGVKELEPGKDFVLRAGGSVVIETGEEVHLPGCMFGCLAPRVSLLQLGLSNTFAKVDPGYNGHLQITLFNLGSRSATLKYGQAFCALTLIRVEDGGRLYAGGAKQQPGQRDRRTSWHKLRDFIEENSAMVHLSVAIVTLLLVLVKGYELVKAAQ